MTYFLLYFLLYVSVIAWKPLLFSGGQITSLRKNRRPLGGVQKATSAEAAELLQAIKRTDRGIRCSYEERCRINALIETCENSEWENRDEWLFRNSEVLYVGQSASIKSNAAGGKFRGRMGRFLFQTQGLYQNLFRKEAINMVAFRLFGLIPGLVVLRGSLNPINATTVRADFEPPVISLAGLFRLRVGPTSSVALTTTYLDQRLRISRGANSQAPFIFAAVSQNDPKANAWRPSFSDRYLSAKKIGRAAIVFSSLGLLWQMLFQNKNFLSFFFLGIGLLGLRLITSTGGIVVDENLHSSLPILPVSTSPPPPLKTTPAYSSSLNTSATANINSRKNSTSSLSSTLLPPS
uniref:Plastid lipid-associated protein/fibrillin conserved domain-containing protein n=1 Tax=Aureoumbra lagunensis TaxID=44058 RepID=A0A7S3K428_9STRA|mmetsp:Transcript_6317/g.8870  ORF Transcript_6317/g.8870 Transcript_6317/m.8870 type:complete len:350 (+) Transcript_6317:42-1091(+)